MRERGNYTQKQISINLEVNISLAGEVSKKQIEDTIRNKLKRSDICITKLDIGKIDSKVIAVPPYHRLVIIYSPNPNIPPTQLLVDIWKWRDSETKTYTYTYEEAAELCYKYAYRIGHRWPEAEPIIMKDPICASNYANYIMHERWPEVEPYIITNAEAAQNYATYVMRKRWPEAEPIIMKEPTCACCYAMYTMKERWLEAEKYIKSQEHMWILYTKNLIRNTEASA